MNVAIILLQILLCSSLSRSREFGLFFQDENAYLQTSYLTVCDESGIKFEVFINRTSGVVMYVENKIKAVKLIVYFERPGMYINVTDGVFKYNLPLTLDFFSNQWDGWHEIEVRLSDQKMHLTFDSTERQIGLQGGHLFPEDVIEGNEIYFGASPHWSAVGNVTRFSGFMRNMKYRSCGCDQWKPIKIIKTFAVDMESQGDCKPKDACRSDCSCYLFPWGGKRCDCPREVCVDSSDQVSFSFDRDDARSNRLQTVNESLWYSSESGPYGKGMSIDLRNSLKLYVIKGRTCFKNVFLCENGFVHSFWILPTVVSDAGKNILILKHSSSLESNFGLSVTRIDDNIDCNLITRDGSSVSVIAPMTLSVWSLVTITYNQTHLSLYMNSFLKDSSDKFIRINQDYSDLLLSTRFLFIGNSRDNPSVTIGNWQFTSDLSSHSLSAINELRFEQYRDLRKTNVNSRLYVEDTFVNLTESYKHVFDTSKLNAFHISLIFNASSAQRAVLVQSTLIKIVVQPLNYLVIDIIGIQSHTTKLTKTINKLYYVEISLTDKGELTVVQSMNVVLLNITVTSKGPFTVDFIRVNSDFNIIKLFRIINTDRYAGIRARRLLTDDVMQYSEDFGRSDIDSFQSLSLIDGFVDQGLLLKHPTKHVSANWFNESCIRYLASCHHGLTISFWIKFINIFEDVNERYFRILSSGSKGLSLIIETTRFYFLLVTESRVTTKFIPTKSMKSPDQWYLIEVTISQNGVPFLFLNRQEAQRTESSETRFSSVCNNNICIGDESSRDNSMALIIDELIVWNIDRHMLYANDYISSGPSGHKLISFTNYQLNGSFTMSGAAKVISTKYGYALGLNNFGPRFASITLTNQPVCFWDLTYCRRGILIRLWLRPDNLAISHQTILSSPFVTVNINLEYLAIQIRASGKTWFLISKDLLQLFTWQIIDISWHRDTGLKTYINGKLTGYTKYGTQYTSVSPGIAPSLSVGIDYLTVGNINYATVLIDDIELFEVDRSNLAYEAHSIDDLSCAVLFSFDDNVKSTILPVLGIVGSAGLFKPALPGAIKITIPTCFAYQMTGCAMCFTVRMWLNIHDLNITVLESGFFRLAIMSMNIQVEIGNIVSGSSMGFFCRYRARNLLNKWNFIEISWDDDEGLLLFVNREGIVCDLNTGIDKYMSGPFDHIEISKEFIGTIDELQLYHARLSVLYWSKTLDESKVLLIIDKIKEKEKVDKEVILLKNALNSATVNRSIEIVDSFQVNGSNYVSYKLPKNSYTYIPGGKEEVEISFKSFNSVQSSIIWVSDSLLSKNTLTLKNKKLYFTKVYILPSSNTSKRLTEELEIHNNIMPNVVYNVIIYQRAGEIVMKTTSMNESNVQSMIGRNPLLPMDSDVYFGGYNDLKFLKYNQINSSLSGIIYKARLKSGSGEKSIDIIQEMATAKQNPNIENHGNVIVIKKVIKPDMPQKASFLATLSYTKVPLMINSPFFSLRLPTWDFNLQTSVEIEFSTLESRGLLLFIGNITDFISLEILDSQLFFIYKYNGPIKRIRTHSDSISVSDNKPHRVYVGRDLSGNIKVYFNRDEVMANATRLEEFTNSVTVIGHLGTYDSWPTEILSRVSFLGCIHFLRINDADYVNFSRNSVLMRYDEINVYGDVSRHRSSSFKGSTCQAPSLSACDNSPCEGGWCQLTMVSAGGQLTNNFKCNCLFSSKSLAIGFSGDSQLHNFNLWIYEYLLQSRSKACTEDTKELVIVDQSSFTVTFRIMFPFVSLLDLEFLILVISQHSCVMEISFEHKNMTIIINNGQLGINISGTNILSLVDVNLHDNQWHGVQLQVRLQSVRVKIGTLQKEFTSPEIPALRVSSIQVGNCAGYRRSQFKIKGLSYNNLNVLNTISTSDHKLFYSTKYNYPIIKEPVNSGRNTDVHRSLTFLNNFQRAITIESFNITWYTQIYLSLTTLYPGIIVQINNGRQSLSCLLCRDKTLIFLHRDNWRKSRIERVRFIGDEIKLTMTIDLIRNIVKVKGNNSDSHQVLRLSIDSWSAGDAVGVQFGVNNPSGDVLDFSGFDSDDRQCLDESFRNQVIGCLNSFVWYDGNKSVSFTDKWNGLMKTYPLESVLIGQCKVVERCRPETCTNGVCTSIDHHNTYCNCSNTDFVGKRCHVVMDKCKKLICLNNGQCVSTKYNNAMDTVYCNCTGTGFSGKNCENVMCPGDFCSHNGKCYTSSNALLCDCSHTSFAGPKCEVPVCKSSTCNGRGACRIVSNTSAQICHCDRGFFGAYCEDNSNGKCQRKCKNEGVCSQYQPMLKLCSNRYCRRLATYECNCDHTIYRGNFCEQAEYGFHPIQDGVLLMENITLEKQNYLRILFEIDSDRNESALVTITKTISESLTLFSINRTLSIKYDNRLTLVSRTEVIGQIVKVNVLLLADHGSRVDFYLNKKLGYFEFYDAGLSSVPRNKRSIPEIWHSTPSIIIGCNKEMLNCFDGLIAGISWNNRHLMDRGNTFVKDDKRYSVDNFRTRVFPKEASWLILIYREHARSFLVTLSVVVVIFLFAFIIARKLWCRSCQMTKVYLREGKCVNNYKIINKSLLVLDAASEMALIESKDVMLNHAVPDSSPELSSQGNYDSKLTVKSISSSISSETEYCRILLLNDAKYANKLNIVDYSPVPGNQIVVVTNFLPEIKIFQSLFPVDTDDMMYKCEEIKLAPCGHYIYCHMTPLHAIQAEEFDIQAWKISNPYELFIRPPNLPFTHSLPFTDDSYRIVLLNIVTSKLSLFEMEFSTILWTRSMTHCYPIPMDPLVLLEKTSKLIVNKDQCFDVIDINNGILRNTCKAPGNASFRQIVGTDCNKLIILTNNFDFYHWDTENDVYDHKQLPARITSVNKAINRNGNKIALGTETGELYLPTDDKGMEYMILGPRNDRDITCVRFSLDGALLAAGFENNLVHIWRLESGVPLCHFHAVHERGEVLDLNFTSDNRKLIVLVVTNRNRPRNNKRILILDTNYNNY